MKIILSESQIIKLLSEQKINSAHQKYIDWLLDKISSGGIESLSSEERTDLDRMSRGEDPIEVKEPEPPSETKTISSPTATEGDPTGRYDDFMEAIPHMHTFVVDGEEWHFSKDLEPHGEFDILIVSNNRISFMIHPFVTPREFEVATAMANFKFHVKNLPNNFDEMEVFVKQFLESDLYGIVKFIKKKQ